MQAYAERTEEAPTKPEIQPTLNKPALTPEQFYEAIGRVLGKRSIYKMLESKELRSFKVGTKHLIPASELNEFFERAASQ